jgi:hypothetical protein
MIETLKIVAATVVVVGIVAGFLDPWYAPHHLLLESSPDRPRWLGWLVRAHGRRAATLLPIPAFWMVPVGPLIWAPRALARGPKPRPRDIKLELEARA